MRRRWFWFSLAGAVAVAVVAVVVLRLRFHGPQLASTVEGLLNSTFRGQMEVESIEWSFDSLPALVTSGSLPVTIRGFEMRDQRGRVVIRTSLVTASIDTHALISRSPQIVIRDAEVPNGAYVLIEEVTETSADGVGQTRAMSIDLAFRPVSKPGIGAGRSASSAPVVDLRNASVHNATVEHWFPSFHLIADGVSTSGSLYADFSDPLTPQLYFSFTPTVEWACLRVGALTLLQAATRDRREHWLARARDRHCVGVDARAAGLDESEQTGVVEIPVRDLAFERAAQLPDWPRDTMARDLVWAGTAKGENNASITLAGKLLGYWNSDTGGSLDIAVTVDPAGALLSRISRGFVGGDDLRVVARVDGPVANPRVSADAVALEVVIPTGGEHAPLVLQLPQAAAWLDLVTASGGVEETVAHGAGGRANVVGRFEFAKEFHYDLEVDIQKPFQLNAYLPDQVKQIAGTQLGGQARIFGDPERQQLGPLNLRLGRVQVSGSVVKDEQQIVHARSLSGRIGKTWISRLQGTIDLTAGALDVGLNVQSEDLDWWLRRFNAPELAKGVDGTVHATGTVNSPQACAALRWSGIPMLDRATSWLEYRDQVLGFHLNKRPSRGTRCVLADPRQPVATEDETAAVATARRAPWRGRLSGDGRIRLGPRPHLLGVNAEVAKLDLAKIPLVPSGIDGIVNGTANVSGPLDKLNGNAVLAFDNLVLLGDTYQVVTSGDDKAGGAACKDKMCLRLQDGKKDIAFDLARRGGGTVGVRASLDAQNQLKGGVGVTKLPLEQLAMLREHAPDLVGGVVTAALSLGGTLETPMIQGDLGVRGGFYDRAFLGNADIRLAEQQDSGRLGIAGTLLQGDLKLDATVEPQAPYRTEIHLVMRRLEIDRFIPALAKQLNARGWVTGQITIATELLPTGSAKPEVLVRLTDAEVIVDNQDSWGRPAPIRLRNQRFSPIAIRFDGTRAELLDEVVLQGPAGAAFAVRGHGSMEDLSLDLKGRLNMQVVEPYVREYFSSVSGEFDVLAQVRGPIEKPEIEVTLGIEDAITAYPVNQEAELSLARGGRVTVTNKQITSTGLQVTVTDPVSKVQTALDVRGGVQLNDFLPAQWAIQAEGTLAGRMLLVAAPEVFSRASGNAEVFVSVLGSNDDLVIDANVDLNSEQPGARPLSITPRGLGRELRFLAGQIEFSDDTVEVRDVAVRFGDGGRVSDLDGTLALKDWRPAHIDATVSASGLPFRIPQVLDITLDADGFYVVGDLTGARELRIGGPVAIVEGRLIRKFNWITDVLRPERSNEASATPSNTPPFLANAKLDVLVDVRSFAVENNLANVQMKGDIDVTGVVQNPLLNGNIRVDSGDFKLPGARAKFTRTQGTVRFSNAKPFPDQTPTLNVQSEGDYRDSNGQYHLITLSIDGIWNQPEWDLYTSTGLNKGQTLTMLYSGRTPADLRKSLGDEAPGTQRGQLSASASDSDNAADQILKDVAGDFISLLVEDTLRNLTSLDVARIEIGTGSIGFYGEKELADNVRFSGSFEQAGSSSSVEVSGQVQVSDRTSVEGVYQNKDYDDPTEEDVSDFRLRTVWRYFFWP